MALFLIFIILFLIGIVLVKSIDDKSPNDSPQSIPGYGIVSYPTEQSTQTTPTDKPCPFCAELIKPDAIKCRHCGEMLKKEDKSSPLMTGCFWIVGLLFFGFIILVGMIGSSDSSSTYIPPPSNEIYIQDEHLANPQDIQQTRDFLSKIPEPCKKTCSAWVKSDGTVHIQLTCIEIGRNGWVEIKDGVVKDVK